MIVVKGNVLTTYSDFLVSEQNECLGGFPGPQLEAIDATDVERIKYSVWKP